ncbi:S8 family serine peptidase [Umezawaea sp. Da 62-37]|uniref:S8 family serine peptidase n=1 Tax=Umezawaea sp. Da 62-37 TaxID=3075927 RepID=UPI0028F72306|nr:S8 family serine peptidase [Umezawaea sp. Da 62-37]WNV83777.1 S8 family serine peptidase [Umezawaea sp. Da 62-37]
MLALGLVVGATQVATAAPSGSRHFDTRDVGSVTLITGDRVVTGEGTGSIVPGPGREELVFSTYTADGHRYVLPSDVGPLLASGKLDRRLFDVTGLIESRYDDSHRDSLPLLVTPAPGRSAAAAVTGMTRTADLPVVGSFAATTAKATATTTWQALAAAPDDYRKIRLDGLRQPSLDRSVPQIGAPVAWQAGYTGTGVKVAVLDTGVDAAHPDLVGQELVERNFTEDPDNTDLVGHGTHVASTIASKGTKYRGVAPDAKILDGKVCVTYGCAESWILNGMVWAAEQDADVVNLSLGGGDSPDIDPLEEAVNTLSAQYGTLFVIAAGNSGAAETVGSPGSADAALTVGAVDRDDDIAPFSSRGPRTGDGAVKPDITAPGVDIVAAKSSTGSIGTPAGDGYVSMSGTSMATPHVAGSAALIKQQHPDWTGAQVKAALVASAKPNPALTAYDQGAGRVDLTRAIGQTVTTDPVSVGLGLQQWPHDDDVAVTEEATYRNSGTESVTLDLALDVKGPDGKPAPAGLFTVDPTIVTVPAGGAAKVSVTGDTRIGTLDGGYSGSIVATSGTTVVRTPVGVVREVESYQVTLNYTGQDGAPSSTYSTLLIGFDNGGVYFPYDEDGSVELRLPKGNYYASTTIRTGELSAVLPYPGFTVTREATVELDARLAKPISVSVPDQGATADFAEIGEVRMQGKSGLVGFTGFLGGFDGRVSIGNIGPAVGADEFSSLISTHWTGTPMGTTPVNHRTGKLFSGKAPTGYTAALAKRDFAEVKTRIGPSAEGRDTWFGLGAVDPIGGGGGWLKQTAAPGEVIDNLAGDGVRWRSSYRAYQSPDPAAPFDTLLNGDPRSYQAGKRYSGTINTAVFGPAQQTNGYHLARAEDTIYVNVALFGDGAGNPGYSAFDSARTTLFREGTKVGETDSDAYGQFPVPAAAGSYRLETEATRAKGVSDVSTKVSGAWTFRSAHAGAEALEPLPLTLVRFQPKLDAANSTPAGRLLRVPLVVQQNPGADNGRVGRVSVDVSFDDGKTWRHAPVVGDSALVFNGPAGGFASLRAKTTDSKGNTAENTVIRAYKIAGR